MDITHIGHASFKIRGKKTVLITDPFDPEIVGLKFPKVEADIVTISHHHPDHDYLDAISGNRIVIEGPGEYEVGGVKITGIPSYHDTNSGKDRGKNTIYKIEIDKIVLAHLGDLGHKLDSEITELLDGVDILMIPTGGFYTIDAKEAASIITSLEPKIIIPMHYFEEQMNKEKFGKLQAVSDFLKEIGKEKMPPLPKLSVNKDKIPEEPSVVVLE